MTPKTLLGIALLGLLAVPFAPTAAALAVNEDCTVDVNTWTADVRCTGLLFENVNLTWCPNHPVISCLNSDLVFCYVGTSGSPFCILL